MLAGVGGSEYVSVHARTGYLATQSARLPAGARARKATFTAPGVLKVAFQAFLSAYPSPARMPSQLRTTARQASVVARPSIGLTVWRCQRSSAA